MSDNRKRLLAEAVIRLQQARFDGWGDVLYSEFYANDLDALVAEVTTGLAPGHCDEALFPALDAHFERQRRNALSPEERAAEDAREAEARAEFERDFGPALRKMLGK